MATNAAAAATSSNSQCRMKGLDYQGQRLHIVQIGLGTNSTFVQNYNDDHWDEWDRSVAWLLEPTSLPADYESAKRVLRGIAIEPVADHIAYLKPLAQGLEGVDLLQVALGEEDTSASLQVLTKEVHAALLDAVPASRKGALKHDLEYLLNMSCFEADSMPVFKHHLEKVRNTYGLEVALESQRSEVWSWRTLVSTCNFRGCEVLLVDTEGFDAKILRSMIKYCRDLPSGHSEWPTLVQFESMGHCDTIEGLGTESKLIRLLEENGYKLLNRSHLNTQLVRNEHPGSVAMNQWLGTFECMDCDQTWRFPYRGFKEGLLCRACEATRRRLEGQRNSWSASSSWQGWNGASSSNYSSSVWQSPGTWSSWSWGW